MARILARIAVKNQQKARQSIDKSTKMRYYINEEFQKICGTLHRAQCRCICSKVIFMNYSLHCGPLAASISDIGGQLCSLTYDGNELIWQGDGIHWSEHAPNLFPFCGKVPSDRYSWQGKSYPMPIHGFLSASQMTPVSANDRSLVLSLTDTPASRAVYPFSFALTLRYTLTDRSLICEATVQAGDTPLPFSFGAHPGFALSYNKEGFERASIVFDHFDSIHRVGLTENGFFTGKFSDYPLAGGNTLPLTPAPALGCGLFLDLPAEMRALTLCAPTLPVDLRLEFADFPYLGLWHDGGDFLCLEPWQGLPAPDSPECRLEDKPATLLLAEGEQKSLRFSIIPIPKQA